ncbi:hypothetical protein Q7C36_004095 [Tachysurus vachellii]|uniref:UBC core domain-containing protein n=1 Tax=Tachysurus vachellii TaxID=175792 RepID=A0AA88NJK8_TACVA|nr:hypothetical protein Q7C36_004095 [Tachysurus vachellii]
MQKEWLSLQNDPPPGMTLKGRRGQKFQLLFMFSSQFPFEPPQVMFTGENIPVHPFVNSNGQVRLSHLTVREWTPVLTVRSMCFVIISILCIWKEKVLNKPHHQDWHWHGFHKVSRDIRAGSANVSANGSNAVLLDPRRPETDLGGRILT